MTETNQGLLPLAAELAGSDDDEQGSTAVARLFAHLRAGHREQWDQEDQSRTFAEADPRRLGPIKQRIDELNDRRIATIQDIDNLIDRLLPLPKTAAPLALTIGQALDRLAIAHVRHEKVGDDLSLVGLVEQAAAWDADRQDVLLARRRPPRGVTRKHYTTAGASSGAPSV